MDWNLGVGIAMPIVTFLGGIYWESRPKLVAHYGHVSGFRSRQPNDQVLEVNTHSVVIRNTSSVTVRNLSVTHNYLPDFDVFPDLAYSVNNLPRGGKEILFPLLTAKEQVTITYLYFPPTVYNQIRTDIRAENSGVKIIDVWQVPVLSKNAVRFIWFLILSGVVAWAYLFWNHCAQPFYAKYKKSQESKQKNEPLPLRAAN